MKQLATIAAIVLLLGSSSCRKHDAPAQVPSCINGLITTMKGRNPVGRVLRYDYNGQTVYFIPSDTCCDSYSYLYDSNCNLICHPDGGITGSGDEACSDFFTKRKNEMLIWKDDC